MRLLPAGDSALLVELANLDEVLGYYAALTADPPEGVVDIVPAARTVLVTIASRSAGSGEQRGESGAPGAGGGTGTGGRRALQRLEAALRAVVPVAGRADAGEQIEIPVIYDGEDLEELAGLLGCGVDELIERHTAEEWTVAFCGFSPGFGYLTGQGEWNVPRRKSPRTKVPAGAVGLAGEFSGIYPRESPGGWQLLGRTEVKIFDQDRDPAALFHPGRRVRFIYASHG